MGVLVMTLHLPPCDRKQKSPNYSPGDSHWVTCFSWTSVLSAHWKNSGGGGDYQPHSSGPSWEPTEVHMAKVFCKLRRTVQMRLHSKEVIGLSWFCQLQRWLTVFSVFSQFIDLSAKQIKTKIFTNMLWIRLQPVWLSEAIVTQCGNSSP